ncbi:MAG: YiiX/YebB-like N1pC/P60 family cysteine hydrolase [Nitrospirota bacterium]
MFEFVGRALARYLTKPHRRGAQASTSRPGALASVIRKGDVLLVEGNSRVSVAIKYLTQSSWSHAALCIGDALGPPQPEEDAKILVDADMLDGVRAIPLSMYAALNTRVCRPVGLSAAEIDRVVAFAVSRVGYRYDLKNVFDLTRYVLRTPPVPARFRRRLLRLGSGDPTRAICSSLIAQAFESVRYPILPEVVFERSDDPACVECYREVLHIRHHSLFVPRDFDVSPYFQIIKPTIERGFDPHAVTWELAEDPGAS